jgi:lipopolysaccharide exporter
MSTPSWAQETRHGLLWSGISLLGNKAVNFVSILVLARLVTPSEFGTVAAVAVFLAFIEVASDLGMKATVVYEQEAGVTARIQSAFTLNLGIAAVLTVVGVLLAPLVADFFGVGDKAYLFRLGALSLLFVGAGNIHDALLIRGMDFRRRTIPQLIQALVRAAVSIGMAVAGFGAESLVVGALAGSAAWTLVQWFMSPLRPTFDLDLGIVRGMASYGSAAALLEVLAVVTSRIDITVIGKVLGEAALGLYTIAFRVPELLIETVAWNSSEVLFPALSRKREDDRGDLTRATMRLLEFQALYAIPVATWMAMVATPLITFLFGSQWTSAGGVTAATAIAAGIVAVIFPLGDVFKALSQQRVLVVLSLCQLPVLIAMVILLAPKGIVTVAWGRAAATAVIACVQITFVLRALESGYAPVLRALRPALSTAAGVLIGAALGELALPSSQPAWLELTVRTFGAAAVGSLAAWLFANSTVKTLYRHLRGSGPPALTPGPSEPSHT